MKKQKVRFLYPLIIFIVISIACGSSDDIVSTESSQSVKIEEQKMETQLDKNPQSDVEQSTSTTKPTPTTKPTNTKAPTKTATNTPLPSATTNPYLVKPGTYIIGKDIQPGIYIGNAGDDIWDSCYWERLSDLSGNFSSIISNNNGIGQFYVEIKDSDYAFTTGCSVFHIDSVPIPTNFLTELSPGTYLIGRDIKAGLYKGQAGDSIEDSCYWERLSAVTGSFSAIRANGNAIGSFYVEVSPTDFALNIGCNMIYQGQ